MVFDDESTAPGSLVRQHLRAIIRAFERYAAEAEHRGAPNEAIFWRQEVARYTRFLERH